MRKTLQKLLIVTTALTFSCNSFSASAMLKGGKNEKNEISKTEMIKKYEELYEQLEMKKKQLKEAETKKDLAELVAFILTGEFEKLERDLKCSQEKLESSKKIVEVYKEKVDELTAELQEHKDKMNKLNTPIPNMDLYDMEDKMIKKDVK